MHPFRAGFAALKACTVYCIALRTYNLKRRPQPPIGFRGLNYAVQPPRTVWTGAFRRLTIGGWML